MPTPKAAAQPPPKPPPPPKRGVWNWLSVTLTLVLACLLCYWLGFCSPKQGATTTVTTTTFSTLGDGFKRLAKSVTTGVNETFAGIPRGRSMDGTIGMTGSQTVQPDKYDDSSIAECPPATGEQQECIIDKRRLVRRASNVEGTLNFCFRWDPIDTGAQFHLFGKNSIGPREAITILQNTEAFDHLDLQPLGKIKFTYSLKEVCPE